MGNDQKTMSMHQDATPPADVPPRGVRQRTSAHLRRWADRRELRRVAEELERTHDGDLERYFASLSRNATVVAAIALVENRPSLRLLQIDFDGGRPSLLASVDQGTLHQLAALRLPALICFGQVDHQHGQWIIELTTLDQVVFVVADELVVAEDLHPASAEGTD